MPAQLQLSGFQVATLCRGPGTRFLDTCKSHPQSSPAAVHPCQLHQSSAVLGTEVVLLMRHCAPAAANAFLWMLAFTEDQCVHVHVHAGRLLEV